MFEPSLGPMVESERDEAALYLSTQDQYDGPEDDEIDEEALADPCGLCDDLEESAASHPDAEQTGNAGTGAN